MDRHELATGTPYIDTRPPVILLQESSAYWSAMAQDISKGDFTRTFAQGIAARHYERMWVFLSAILGVAP